MRWSKTTRTWLLPTAVLFVAGRIQGARLEILLGCGHMANMERPEAFNSVVLDFLRENRDRAR